METDLNSRAHLAQRLDRITQAVALVGFLGLVVMALLTFYDGAARYLGMPRISGFTDLGQLVFPLVIASCFPAGLLRGSHISVRLLGQTVARDKNAWLEFFASIVTLAFFSLIAWQLVLMAGAYGETGRTTHTVELALAPWWWIVAAVMAICVPTQLFVAAAWLVAAVKRVPSGLEPLAAEPHQEQSGDE